MYIPINTMNCFLVSLLPCPIGLHYLTADISLKIFDTINVRLKVHSNFDLIFAFKVLLITKNHLLALHFKTKRECDQNLHLSLNLEKNLMSSI